MDQAKTILCVLREEQRQEYEAEFNQLRQLGIELIFESCDAL